MEQNIASCKNMVASMAYKYSYNKSDFDDLYQVGMIGLLNALEHYEKNSDTKFSTFAHIYIKGEILKYLKKNRSVKVKDELIHLNQAILKLTDVLTQKLMRNPTYKEIADALGISEEKVIEAISACDFVKSLDYELNEQEEGKELNLYNAIHYEEEGYKDDILMLKDAIKDLSEEERTLILSRYYEDKSQQETSEILGMSQCHVSRNEAKILTKLRNKIVCKYFFCIFFWVLGILFVGDENWIKKNIKRSWIDTNQRKNE